MISTSRTKKALSKILIVAVAAFYVLVTNAAFAQITPQPAGYLTVQGSVTLNGINAESGSSVFSGSQIRTGASGAAVISLGRLGQIELAPGSELTLKLEAAVIGGYLQSGKANITAPSGISVNITTADGIAVADGKQDSVLTIDLTSGNTRVASARNEAKLIAGDKVESIAAGQEVSVGIPATTTSQNSGGVPIIDGLELVALVVLGVSGGIVGIIAATKGNTGNANNLNGPLSNFR